MGGAGMLQEMGSTLGDIGGAEVLADEVAQGIGVKTFPASSQESGLLFAFQFEPRPNFFEVALYPMQGRGGRWAQADLAPLPLPDLQNAFVLVQAAEFETFRSLIESRVSTDTLCDSITVGFSSLPPASRFSPKH